VRERALHDAVACCGWAMPPISSGWESRLGSC
jgi:hypothetical protein